jgi:Xaa-Pro aminopeptidase
VVTTSDAALWTDGRYFLQAESQLGSEWTLMRAGTPGVPDVRRIACICYLCLDCIYKYDKS